MTADLDASYLAARAIMREHAHTFSFAARWFRPERRRAVHALYALFRTLDDIADEAAAGRDPAAARAALASWRAWLCDPDAAPRPEPIALAVRATLARYAIPVSYLLCLIDGLEMDLDGRRYATVADLTGYCFRVAATVGLAMCHVLDARDPRALAHAAELGVAMQLTNILRDVEEDLGVGRVYLPADRLAAAGWSADRLAGRHADAALCALLADLARYARCYYARGLAGLPYLSADGRFAILVAARCYAGILDRIAATGHDPFAGRAHVSGLGKLQIALACARPRLPTADPLPPLPVDAPTGADLLRLVSPAPLSPPPWPAPAPLSERPPTPTPLR